MYLALQFRALLPQVRAWRDEFFAYRGATEQELADLARWIQEPGPLPRWLARVGCRRLLRGLLQHEPSETAVYLLARRHKYSPHTVRRYVGRFMQSHRALSLVAYGAQYVPADSFTDGDDYWHACVHEAVARLKPHAAQLPRAWAKTLHAATEALKSDALEFFR